MVLASADPLADVPATLKALDQWLVWRSEPPRKPGAKPTKVPYVAGASDRKASTADRSNWRPFDLAVRAWRADRTIAGVGFVFAEGGGLVGLDLDDSLDADGRLVDWARPLFDQVGAGLTYGEVSPSLTGLKCVFAAELPADPLTGEAPKGRNRRRGTKAAPKPGGVELYPSLRYFAITGRRFGQCSADVGPGDPAGLARLYARMAPPRPPAVPYVPTAAGGGDRADWCWRYLLKCPESVSGAGGHDKALRAACECVRFDLTPAEALDIMRRWSALKSGGEPWTERELAHKLASAERHAGRERGRRIAERERRLARLPSHLYVRVSLGPRTPPGGRAA